MENKKLDSDMDEEYCRNLYHYYDQSLFYETCDIDVATALTCTGFKVLFVEKLNPKKVIFVFENRLCTQGDCSLTTEIAEAYLTNKPEINPRFFRHNLRVLKNRLLIMGWREIFQKPNCPVCKEEIVVRDMRDVLSKKEFAISGLCQKCQDKTFK